MDHIAAHSTGHSEAILTADEAAARAFLGQVDSAAVYWNASTRFTDGGEFGLGCEMGISTQSSRPGAHGPGGAVLLQVRGAGHGPDPLTPGFPSDRADEIRYAVSVPGIPVPLGLCRYLFLLSSVFQKGLIPMNQFHTEFCQSPETCWIVSRCV